MALCSKRINVFNSLNSDLKRTKTFGTKGKRYLRRGKQPKLLAHIKTKRNYNIRSRRIRKPTELE
jgi:hypothetical protein